MHITDEWFSSDEWLIATEEVQPESSRLEDKIKWAKPSFCCGVPVTESILCMFSFSKLFWCLFVASLGIFVVIMCPFVFLLVIWVYFGVFLRLLSVLFQCFLFILVTCHKSLVWVFFVHLYVFLFVFFFLCLSCFASVVLGENVSNTWTFVLIKSSVPFHKFPFLCVNVWRALRSPVCSLTSTLSWAPPGCTHTGFNVRILWTEPLLYHKN